MSAVPQVAIKRLRIGELATRTGHTVHAIRWYESQGLIPGVIRDAGGRRSYLERHLGWIELIDKLRLTGMSISQIRDYAHLVSQGRGTIKQQQEMLRAHRDRVYATIDEWYIALKMLDHKIEYFDEWLATGKRPVESPGKALLQHAGSRTHGGSTGGSTGGSRNAASRPRLVNARR